MSETVTAYQYSPTSLHFIGEYQVHVHPDKSEKIHLPPHTTLDKPPVSDNPLKVASWVGENWELKSLI